MTIIGEHMFATGDDNGVVKGILYLYCFFFTFFVLLYSLHLYINTLNKYGIFDKEGICQYFHYKKWKIM